MATTASLATALLTSTTSSSSTGSSDIVPKIVITFLVLAIGFGVAVILAKLINYCNDRRDVPDDASDLSEYTKNLLRKQLDLMRFGFGKKSPLDDKERQVRNTTEAINIWRLKVMQKSEEKKKKQEEDDSKSKILAPNVHIIDEHANDNSKKPANKKQLPNNKNKLQTQNKTGLKKAQSADCIPVKLQNGTINNKKSANYHSEVSLTKSGEKTSVGLGSGSSGTPRGAAKNAVEKFFLSSAITIIKSDKIKNDSLQHPTAVST